MPIQDRPPPPEPSKERTKGWGVIGLALVVIGFVVYIAFFILVAATGLYGATSPDMLPMSLMLVAGLSVLCFVVGVGVLIAKVLIDRVFDREDGYYSRHIER